MTLKEAWLALAAAWRQAEVRDYGCVQYSIALVDGYVWFGLCDGIVGLLVSGKISLDQAATMDVSINTYRSMHNKAAYLWPRTSRGALARSLFCEKMARQCKQD